MYNELNATPYQKAGDFNLSSFVNLISYQYDANGSDLKRLNIHNLVQQIEIFESISSNVITGSIAVLDATGTLKDVQISGFERLEFKYSDLPFYFLKFWFEEIYNKPLDLLAEERIFNKLQLERTMFNPYKKIKLDEIVPSEEDDFFRYSKLHGYVHDEGAAMLGGVSGHAGLFSNSYEVAVILQAMIQGGIYNNQRLFKSESFDVFNTCYFCEYDNRSGVGFDKPQIEGTHGSTFGGVSMNSFGHYGYTGSMAWADPDEEIIFVFLSNRTFPTRENTLLQKSNIRTRSQEIVYKSIID